jgi:hypothetical protein
MGRNRGASFSIIYLCNRCIIENSSDWPDIELVHLLPPTPSNPNTTHLDIPLSPDPFALSRSPSPVLNRNTSPPLTNGPATPAEDFRLPSRWFEHVSGIRAVVAHWVDGWGPVERWPLSIAEEFRLATETEEGGSEWLQDMSCRVEYAKDSLGRLRAFSNIPLPDDPINVLDLWRQAFDLGLALHAVILCLEAQPMLPRPPRLRF